MKWIDNSVKNIFCSIDSSLRSLLESKPSNLRFYENTIIPFEIKLLRWHGNSIGNRAYPYLEQSLHDWLPRYLSPEELSDAERRRKIEDDMIKSRVIHGVIPLEYVLYGYEPLDYWARQEFINDHDRWEILHKRFGEKVKRDHKDKWRFYQLVGQYFKREACRVGKGTPQSDFMDFVARHPRFFVKQLEGCFGRNAYLLEAHDTEKAQEIYDKLFSHGAWIVEEVIQQSKEMSAWNASSVNTVRMASFLTASGEHHIMAPFFRAGRVGSIIDNACSGGMVAGVDEQTGRLLYGGFDENGLRYETHPDSGHKIEGWQLPEWSSLCQLTEEVHRAMPPGHRYVAFDFAHTEDGWVLVEGNWGQLIFNQAGSRRGLKKQFLEYIR
jgi:hypothetical protein